MAKIQSVYLKWGETEEATLEVGGKIKFGTGRAVIEQIELDPVGGLIISLSGARAVYIANVPMQIELAEAEIKKVK